MEDTKIIDPHTLIGHTITKVDVANIKAEDSEYDEDYPAILSLTLDDGRTVKTEVRWENPATENYFEFVILCE
jgi:hypothetical protein